MEERWQKKIYLGLFKVTVVVLIVFMTFSQWGIVDFNIPLYEIKIAKAVATDNLIAFWDGGTPPTGWSCVSCGSGDFYQKFPRGAATYGGTGGATTHNDHTITRVSVTGTPTSPLLQIAGTVAQATKTHTHTTISNTTMGSGTLLPVYQNIKVIRYDTTGTPATIPSGVILMFDAVPSGSWERYTAQDTDFIYGENDATGTGGAATHTHGSVGYTLGPSANTAELMLGNAAGAGSFDAHTHTVSGKITASGNHTPPYLDVLLYKATGETTLPDGVIAMWDATPEDTNWTVNSGASQTFNGKFLRGNSSYTGTPGGATTHNHSNLASATGGSVEGANYSESSAKGVGAIYTHTHTVTVSFGNSNNLPPYIDVIIAKYTAPLAGTLAVSIVDADGVDVGSPSVTMNAGEYSFVYQTVSGTLGSASQKIRFTNETATATWTLAIAATGGATAVWSDGGSNTYDFNDPTASAADGVDDDTKGGQLTLNPNAGTVTAEVGCDNTGVSKGSQTSFSEGSADSVTLMSADGTASTGCYWDLTGVTLSQTIPADQTVATYTLGFTLTAS